MISRARATALLLGGAAASLSRPARGQTPLSVRVVTTHLESAAGAFYAQSLGLFRKYGLEVDLQVMNNGSAAAAAVAGGAADIGSSNIFSLLIAHSKGVDLRLIVVSAEYLNDQPTTALVVEKSSSAHSAADMRGKSIAVTGVGDLDQLAVQAWLANNGVDPTAAKFVELVPLQMAPALQRGSIDAAQIGSPALQGSLTDGRILALSYSAIANRFNQNGWYVHAGWLAQHREEASRFARAMFEAQGWANHNRNASVTLLAQWSHLDPKLIAAMTRVVYSERFDAALVQPLIAVAVRFKAIPSAFPAGDVFEAL